MDRRRFSFLDEVLHPETDESEMKTLGPWRAMKLHSSQRDPVEGKASGVAD